jgi:hypothetical protein
MDMSNGSDDACAVRRCSSHWADSRRESRCANASLDSSPIPSTRGLHCDDDDEEDEDDDKWTRVSGWEWNQDEDEDEGGGDRGDDGSCVMSQSLPSSTDVPELLVVVSDVNAFERRGRRWFFLIEPVVVVVVVVGPIASIAGTTGGDDDVDVVKDCRFALTALRVLR